MTHPHRILTVMEGRPENDETVESLALTVKKRPGWKFYRLAGIDSNRVACYDFDGIPLDYIVFRELTKNSPIESERVMHWLRHNHKLCINADVTGRHVSTSDKHFQQGIFLLDPVLKEYALPTYEAKNKDNIISCLEHSSIHFPFLLKDRRGSCGRNIKLINSLADLDKIEGYSRYLVEQYIKPECDFRVFVIGGVAVGAVRKTGDFNNPGDFGSWSSGVKKSFEQDPDLLDRLSEIATRAASVSKLEYAGIDIIKEANSGKLYLLETNIAAGWQNLTDATFVDIPNHTLDWFEIVSDGRNLPVSDAVARYLAAYRKYLPLRIRSSCVQILRGIPEAVSPYYDLFAKYPRDYLYDANYLFSKLATAFLDVTKDSRRASNYTSLVSEIESMPLSWTGDFIGPEVGTFHDGAILSALYLFLLHKIRKI